MMGSAAQAADTPPPQEHEDQKGFYVDPKTDCPHLQDHVVLFEDMESICNVHQPCAECGLVGENWLSLEEHKVYCSRYKNGHMASRYEECRHQTADGHHGCVVMSFADLSFWCYACDEYVTHPVLKLFHDAAHLSKFGEPTHQNRASGRPQPSSNLGVDPNEDVEELFDEPDVLDAKVEQLARKVKSADRVVVFTGAGISTSAGVPDFRGPNGVWTARAKGLPMPRGTPWQIYPTFAHLAIRQLQLEGKVSGVVSQNTDGVHRRSGLPLDCLAELHGNANLEVCASCGLKHYRDFHTRMARGSKEHDTGRSCMSCRGPLQDTIVNFGEMLPEEEVAKAESLSREADLALVLGTSMRVSPANKFPQMASDMVICNLQPTPLDHRASLVIRARTDEVMRRLLAKLEVPVQEHVEERRLLVGIRPVAKSSGAGSGGSSQGAPPGLECFVGAVSGYTQLSFHRNIQSVAIGLSSKAAAVPVPYPHLLTLPADTDAEVLAGGVDVHLEFCNHEDVPPLHLHLDLSPEEVAEALQGQWLRQCSIFFRPCGKEWSTDGISRDHIPNPYS